MQSRIRAGSQPWTPFDRCLATVWQIRWNPVRTAWRLILIRNCLGVKERSNIWSISERRAAMRCWYRLPTSSTTPEQFCPTIGNWERGCGHGSMRRKKTNCGSKTHLARPKGHGFSGNETFCGKLMTRLVFDPAHTTFDTKEGFDKHYNTKPLPTVVANGATCKKCTHLAWMETQYAKSEVNDLQHKTSRLHPFEQLSADFAITRAEGSGKFTVDEM